MEDCGFYNTLMGIKKKEEALEAFLRSFNIILYSILKRKSFRVWTTNSRNIKPIRLK